MSARTIKARRTARTKRLVKNSVAKVLPRRLGARIIAGLKEASEVLESGQPLESRFTVRTVESLPEPTPYDAHKVRHTRQRVGASQAVFAKLVGVSTIQAQSWEQGKRQPSKLARRLLDEINRDPAHWRGMIGVVRA